MKKTQIGVIGCGIISGHYLSNAKKLYSDFYEIAAVTDINMDLAKKQAGEFSKGAS